MTNINKHDFFEYKGSLDEQFDAVLRHQESQGFSLKFGDGKDYWTEIDHQELARNGKYKGVKLYKLFNAGRDQYFRDVVPQKRKSDCILCLKGREPKDRGIIIDKDWEAKANIFPILKGNHGILIYKKHIEQELKKSSILKVLKWIQQSPDYRFFYNGKYAGASIVDHLHIQFFKTFEPFGLIGDRSPIELFVQNENNLKLIKEKKDLKIYSVLDYPVKDKSIRAIFIKTGPDKLNNTAKELEIILKGLEKENLDYNVLWRIEAGLINIIVFPRSYKGFGPDFDLENRIIRIEKNKRYLLDKDRKTNKREKTRGFATIEFSGVFVAVDQKQYNLATYDDFVILLNQLGVPDKT